MKPAPDHDTLFHIAEGQAGYFSAGQARLAGFSHSLLAYHVRSGLFERVQHGVYRLKRFPSTPYEDLFVACLRSGPQAVVSHDSALALYELSDHLPAEIHLTVPRSASRRHAGLRLHTKRLEACEITRVHGLQVTTVPRTIMDVAVGGLAEELVSLAIRQSVQRGMTTLGELQRAALQGNRRAADLIARALDGDQAN